MENELKTGDRIKVKPIKDIAKVNNLHGMSYTEDGRTCAKFLKFVANKRFTVKKYDKDLKYGRIYLEEWPRISRILAIDKDKELFLYDNEVRNKKDDIVKLSERLFEI